MTTSWKTWMRERRPSTTRTCTLTVSPGRKSGMSLRNESASSASRVFISAVLMFWLSAKRSVDRCRQRSARPSESVAAPRGGAPVGGTGGLQQLSTVPHLQDRKRGGPDGGPERSSGSSSASSGGADV